MLNLIPIFKRLSLERYITKTLISYEISVFSRGCYFISSGDLEEMSFPFGPKYETHFIALGHIDGDNGRNVAVNRALAPQLS